MEVATLRQHQHRDDDGPRYVTLMTMWACEGGFVSVRVRVCMCGGTPSACIFITSSNLFLFACQNGSDGTSSDHAHPGVTNVGTPFGWNSRSSGRNWNVTDKR